MLLKEIRIESIGQEIGDKAKIKLHMILLPLSLTPDAAKPARRSPQAASAMLSPLTLSPQNAGGININLNFSQNFIWKCNQCFLALLSSALNSPLLLVVSVKPGHKGVHRVPLAPCQWNRVEGVSISGP